MKTAERTGLFSIDARNSLDKLKEPLPSSAQIKNPLMTLTDAKPFGVSRSDHMRVRPPLHLSEITNAYLADGYVHQGIDRHAELLIKPNLKGKEKPVAYLNKRLTALSIATGKPWRSLVLEVVHCYIKYANAFLVKVRKPVEEVFGAKRTISKKGAVAGYFLAPVESMFPEVDNKGHINKWMQQAMVNVLLMPDSASNIPMGFFPAPPYGSKSMAAMGDPITFELDDIVHLRHNPQPGAIFGLPDVAPVIEDVRLFRLMEEDVAELVRKNLNPIIHHAVPDVANNGLGRQSDIDRAVSTYSQMSTDGVYITPPGHTIKVIGAESHAIRAEGYLKHFLERTFAGLGVSPVLMGGDAGAYGNADAMVAIMVNRVKFYQDELNEHFQWYIFNELLFEGGFNPYENDDDKVELIFGEFDTEAKVKQETHLADMYNKNVITINEAREGLGRTPLLEGDKGESGLYVNKVQIPLEIIKAKAKGDAGVQIAKAKPLPKPAAPLAKPLPKPAPKKPLKN